MYRFLLTLTATAAILATASLMPNGAAGSPVGQRADIAKTYKQTDGLNGLDQCQFRGEYGQDLRERRERLEQERRERLEQERRERVEHERHEPH
jgi:hypothetical protein